MTSSAGSASTLSPTGVRTRAPTSGRTRPSLGDIAADFDFAQAPLPPVILPLDPKTDLITSAFPSARTQPGPSSLLGPRAFGRRLRRLLRRLGLRPPR